MDVEAIFKQWHKPIRSWLRNTGRIPPIWIDDLAQEVFVRLLRYAKDVELENTAGYMFRIAANVANEWREKSAQRQIHVEVEESHVGVTWPDREREHQEMVRIVETAMSQLPSRQLLILMLYVYEDMTYKEIGKELGLTYRTVLRELVRAYSKLRMKLHKSDIVDIVVVEPEDLRNLINDGRET